MCTTELRILNHVVFRVLTATAGNIIRGGVRYHAARPHYIMLHGEIMTISVVS